MPINGLSRFTGHTVIVTGAASGIGLATGLRFLDEGARVIFVDRDKKALHAATDGLDPERAIASLTDVSVPSQVQALLEFVRNHFGKLDVLVNNAGVTAMGTVLDCDLATWNTVCATILNGTIDVSRTFLPMLIESKGNIVNTASVSGMRGDWNTAYYDVAKGGVVNLTRVMAMDHGHTGVRVNAICPSVTRTGMTKDAVKNTAFVKSVEDRIPLGRLGLPEDMAAAITFLASADAAYITGLIMPVDGGVTASNGQPPFPMG
ncbi:SDR family oxidoreductase [Acetobacter sp. TBRC 12305]|uniref:SDR family oxidoreductase n=1 Tax=Acetobacter garciniae TaxID=2817435 RepID=A0A939HMD5_9PROT|nr:SDR family oxidoreductase [Acetobacter garciniae]MBO1324299.1 SDR family oxidoreductase [Acetobacter garciniae]MBX0343988.1 SDR family oxidoreductase [Acetobacter garciniae]